MATTAEPHPRPLAPPGPDVTAPPVRGARYPLVDSIRTFAVLSLFVHHIGGAVNGRYDNALAGYMDRWRIGFVLAFTVSGFLLYRPFIRARYQGRESMRLSAFGVRRLLRIVPAYWLALTLTGLLLQASTVDGPFGPKGLLFYTLGQAFDPATYVNGVSSAWSLTVEASYYLFLPVWLIFMGWVIKRRPKKWMSIEIAGLAGLALISFAYKILVIGDDLSDTGSADYNIVLVLLLPRYLDHFVFGMALAVFAVVVEAKGTPSWLKPIERFPSLTWLPLPIVAWIVATQSAVGGDEFHSGQAIPAHYLYSACAVLMMLPTIVGNPKQGLLRKALGARWVRWIGLVSYGVFLFHVLIRDLFAKWGLQDDIANALGIPTLVSWFVVTFAVTLLVAAASWYWFEKPLLALKRLEPGVAPLPDGYRPLAPRRLVLGGALVLLVASLAAARFSLPGILLALLAAAALAFLFPAVRRQLPAMKMRPTSAIASLGVVASALIVAFLIGGSFNSSAAAGDSSKSTHLAASYDGQWMRVFVNGNVVAARRYRDGISPSTDPFEIGSYLGKANWAGRIDEVALYRNAVGPATLGSHFLSGRVGVESGAAYEPSLRKTPGLFRLWRLGEPSGTGTTDVIAGKPATAGDGVTLGARGLLAGDGNLSARFRGPKASIVAQSDRALDRLRRFTVEAWVSPGRRGTGTIAAKPGTFFLSTNVYNQPVFGLVKGGRTEVLTAPNFLRLGSDAGGAGETHPLAYIALVAAVALATGGLALRRMERLRLRVA